MLYSNALPEHPIDQPFLSSSGNHRFGSQEAAWIGIYYPRWINPVKQVKSDKSKKASGFSDRIYPLEQHYWLPPLNWIAILFICDSYNSLGKN